MNKNIGVFIVFMSFCLVGCNKQGLNKILGIDNEKSSPESVLANPTYPDPVPFESLAAFQYNQTELSAPALTKITNQQQLEEVERAMGIHESIPSVDFNSYMCVLVQDKTHPTGGYTIQVKQVRAENGKFHIYATRTTPNSSDIVAQVLTQPGHLIKTPKTSLPLELILTIE